VKSAAITNLDTQISAGNEIFTYTLVETTSKSPHQLNISSLFQMRVIYVLTMNLIHL